MTRRRFLASSAAVAASPLAFPAVLGAKEYDVAILHGRVIDPESGLDSVRNIGVTGGKIMTVTRAAIRGKKTIDARSKVVCPGFIDPISHGQDLENDLVQVLDGVTTKLQLEVGVSDVTAWYASQEGTRICNYGAGTSHTLARSHVLGEDSAEKVAAPSQSQAMCRYMDDALRRGALAVGFGLEYNPAATRMEVLDAFRVAGRHSATCHCHVRYGTVFDDQSVVVGIQEVLACAVAASAPLHICHVPSMGLGRTDEGLKMISQAQSAGIDVTSDFYPYTAFGTGIGSEVFSEGWQKRFGIDYGDLEWCQTHERLTAETFAKYQKEGGEVLAHAIPESAVVSALVSRATMVGTDGGLEKGVGHPRSSGTYARVLGRYVREQKCVSLVEAIGKMTLAPARRMERRCPAFKSKGRIKSGADADIVVFDPETVVDRATFDKPALASVGFEYVLIGGELAVENGKRTDSRPGKPVRSPGR